MPTLPSEAYHGIAGEYAGVLTVESEADPAAVLLSFLVMSGAKLGRDVFFGVGGGYHYPNLFALVVGRTSKARKTFSVSLAENTFRRVFPDFMGRCVCSGLTTGEGIVHRVRDPIQKEGAEEALDEGIEDKRLLAIEDEFVGILAKMRGDENTLSRVLRNAFDGRNLETMSKGKPQVATEPHISLVGTITAEELRARMPKGEWSNGFANRLLYCATDRTRILPNPPDPDERALKTLDDRLKHLLSGAVVFNGPDRQGRVVLSDDARAVYDPIYLTLESDEGETAGSRLTQRAPQQLLRLAMIYALLDGTTIVSPEHIHAAYAIVRHSAESAEAIFGNRLADPLAERIVDFLAAVEKPATRTDIHHRLSNHANAADISAALELLKKQGMASAERVATGGKPKEAWTLTAEGRRHAGLV